MSSQPIEEATYSFCVVPHIPGGQMRQQIEGAPFVQILTCQIESAFASLTRTSKVRSTGAKSMQ